MIYTDIARRVYNHAWNLDPIVRSLLDTDFYKLLMMQMIWKLYPDIKVTFTLINRVKTISLAKEVNKQKLIEQLDHARSLRFSKKEMIWLAGNTFYGKKHIFDPDFLAWLENFQLPEYELRCDEEQLELRFHGIWAQTTMWEIPALAIISELRSRAALKNLGRFFLDVLYARAKTKMWSKVERLKKLSNLKICDFGTRRRHSFLWHCWCVEALKEGIEESFIGTSNALLAMNTDLEALGTNAHELPMVVAALAKNDEELRDAPYRSMRDWSHFYEDNLLIVLPDAFGTESFLENAPKWTSEWTGFRLDSAPPIEGGERIIRWWQEHGKDARDKLLIFSDSLNIETIESTFHHFAGRVRMSFGWGTNLTNDFESCAPTSVKGLDSGSFLVCKVSSVNGYPAVKLSDTLEKVTGDVKEVERYLRFFR